MSKKKPKNNISKDKTSSSEDSPAEKKGPNIIYTIVSVAILLSGITFLILGQALKNDVFFFISLGLLGLGIMLLVQRSVYKQSSSTSKSTIKNEEKEEDGLRMRERR